MISFEQIQYLLGGGGRVVGADGDKIGNVGQVYIDDRSGNPEWMTVTTGLFGGGELLVPLAEGTLAGDQITVPYDKDKVKDAPQVKESEDHLSIEQEAELYRYYGMDYSRAKPDSGPPSDHVNPASGMTTDRAMTGSEEQPQIAREQITIGKPRLRKYVVTDNVA